MFTAIAASIAEATDLTAFGAGAVIQAEAAAPESSPAPRSLSPDSWSSSLGTPVRSPPRTCRAPPARARAPSGRSAAQPILGG